MNQIIFQLRMRGTVRSKIKIHCIRRKKLGKTLIKRDKYRVRCKEKHYCGTTILEEEDGNEKHSNIYMENSRAYQWERSSIDMNSRKCGKEERSRASKYRKLSRKMSLSSYLDSIPEEGRIMRACGIFCGTQNSDWGEQKVFQLIREKEGF